MGPISQSRDHSKTGSPRAIIGLGSATGQEVELYAALRVANNLGLGMGAHRPQERKPASRLINKDRSMKTSFVQGLSHWRFGVALSALILLLAIAGCQEKQTTAADSSATGAKSTGDAKAAKLLQEVVATYKTANQYEDAGELHITAVGEGGQSEESPAIPFSVAFERPNNKFRIHSLQSIRSTIRFWCCRIRRR
jgi:hypothetical protein